MTGSSTDVPVEFYMVDSTWKNNYASWKNIILFVLHRILPRIYSHKTPETLIAEKKVCMKRCHKTQSENKTKATNLKQTNEKKKRKSNGRGHKGIWFSYQTTFFSASYLLLLSSLVLLFFIIYFDDDVFVVSICYSTR